MRSRLVVVFLQFLTVSCVVVFTADGLANEEAKATLPNPTPEQWAMVDSGMAKRIQMRDDMKRIVVALKQLSETPRHAAKDKEAELAVIEKDIADYSAALNKRYEIRMTMVERPGAATQPSPAGNAGVFRNPEVQRGRLKLQVFPECASAQSIIFACDASASMNCKFASLKEQINKTIVCLDSKQSFNFVFFHEKEPEVLNQKGLLGASWENKRRASAALEEVTTSKTTDPIIGLRAAFAQSPEMIYLLTDGDFPDNPAVYKAIRELNAQKKVRINTILYSSQPAFEADAAKLLKDIAAENGGKYTVVDETQLE